MPRWIKFLAIGLGLIVAIVVVAGAIFFWRLSDRSQQLATAAVAQPFPLADCTTLQRPATPNHWFVAGGECEAQADAPAPVFDMPAAAQAALWREWLGAQDGVQVVQAADDTAPLQIRVIAHTPVFGFADVVAIKVLPIGEGRSTVAIYSRSLVGESDWDTNKKRVQDWIDGISAEAGRN